MSYDEYVHHIAQKYRLAVAISVIKSKPDNLSIEEYLLQLQTKIKDAEIDLNNTVCSDDFNFDPTPYENNQSNRTGRTKCDTADRTGLDHFGNGSDCEESQTILNDFVFGNDLESNNVNVQRESYFEETINLLKEGTTDVPEEHIIDQNLSQTTFCESQEAIDNIDNDITYCTSTINNPHNVIEIKGREIQNVNVDSQETQLYTLHGFTQNYTHVSQTQGEYFEIPEIYIRHKTSNDNNKQNNFEDICNNADRTDIMSNVNQNVLTQNEFAIPNEEVGNSVYKVNVENNFSNTQFQIQDVINEYSNINNLAAKDYDYIEKVTQNEKYTENASLAQTFQVSVHNTNEQTRISKEATITRESDFHKDRKLNLYGSNKPSDFNNDTPFLSFGTQNMPVESTDSKMEYIDIQHKNNYIQYSQEIIETGTSIDNGEDIENVKKTIEDENIVMEYRMEEDESDSEHFQERVPFKVIEELNRVKSFLNRKDRRNDGGYSTDSGYRSDSKSRSLMSSSQLSGTGAWLNQSAHCLFNHILQTSGADDIAKEIAQVLGQLIDKLHEEENYPPFLEELLETVDQMVKEMHEEETENVLMAKEENVQHLVLLNKSKHILQYTIEKINIILQDLHTNLTQENLYELSNINKVENVCYIFHILEIFLKRYMKVKDVSSQSTQNSQDDCLTKRSSLTELWRKKWNLNSKEVIKTEHKTCVLKRCREILNKIIVECMEGYSLVAFAALQCFNLIQV